MWVHEKWGHKLGNRKTLMTSSGNSGQVSTVYSQQSIFLYKTTERKLANINKVYRPPHRLTQTERNEKYCKQIILEMLTFNEIFLKEW